MQQIKEKKGYVLLTVLCIFAFLTVLGFTILTASLAGMKSVERKLASAQVDAYLISLAESVNDMVEAGKFEVLIAKWSSAFGGISIPEGKEDVLIEKGAENKFESTDIKIGSADTALPDDTIRMEGIAQFLNVSVKRDPLAPSDPSRYQFSGTLQITMQLTYISSTGKEIAYQFVSSFTDNAPTSWVKTWKLYSFEKRRDYVVQNKTET